MKLHVRTTVVAGLVLAMSVGATAALGAPGVSAAPTGGGGAVDGGGGRGGAVTIPRAAHGPQAVRLLGGQLDEAAALNDRTPAELSELLLDDRTAWVDETGRLYYVEPVAPRAAAPPGGAGAAAYPLSQTFDLHSKADSQRVLYLDFDGEVVTGTGWNSAGHPTLDAAAFSTDGDAGFSAAEQEVVQSVWQRVAEDYAPFDIDVTTEDPGAEAIERSNSADQRFGTRALITSDDEVWAAVCQQSCGGVAFVGVFDLVGNAFYQPAWVFAGGTGPEAKGIAEAASHEVGHNFGLSHDGNASDGYDVGHQPWAPIMGASYYQPITQWSRGEYAGANNTEDDLAVIAANGAPVRSDEAGSTVTTAAAGVPTATAYVATAADSDVYALGTCTGEIVLDAQPAPTSPDLDVRLSLLAADGSALAAADPGSARIDGDRASGMSASLTRTVSSAPSFVRVEGVGNGDGVTGYTDYASVGAYTLTRSGAGTCGNPRTAPGAPTATSATRSGSAVTLAWAPPASDGGSAVTGYTVRIDDGAPVSLGASARSHQFTGQTSAAHTVRVAAVNAVGTGSAATAGVDALTVPGPPEGTSIRAAGDLVTVGWSVGAGYPLDQVTGWRVTPYVNGVAGRAVTQPATARSFQLRVATGGQVRFTIAAVSGGGVGTAASTGTVQVTVVRAPSPPRIGKAVPGAKKGKVTATAQWSPPVSTNGATVTGYQVFAYQLNASSGVIRTLTTPTLSASARSAKVRLPRGRYRFAVRAANSAGWSALSAQSKIVKAR